MNLYLDIDGVLLTKDLQVPKHGVEFIEFCVSYFNCFWLTSHCRHGENKAVSYLLNYYPRNILPYLNQVKPAFWDSLKTEGIDFAEPFYWLDDYHLQAEIDVLFQQKQANSIIKVNLSNCGELPRIIQIVKY